MRFVPCLLCGPLLLRGTFLVRPEKGKLESGLTKERKLGKGKLHFSDRFSRLQKMSVEKKESYLLTGVCTEGGGGCPTQKHTTSTPEMSLQVPRNDFTLRIRLLCLLLFSYETALVLMTTSC